MFESVEVAVLILIDYLRVKLEKRERQWIWMPGCT